MSKKDTKAQIMDGQKILGFIFDEFSQDTNEIAQFFENGDGCEKVFRNLGYRIMWDN